MWFGHNVNIFTQQIEIVQVTSSECQLSPLHSHSALAAKSYREMTHGSSESAPAAAAAPSEIWQSGGVNRALHPKDNDHEAWSVQAAQKTKLHDC